MVSPVRTAVVAIAALAGLAGGGSVPVAGPTAAEAAPASRRIAGTWDLTWRNSRGEIRRGSMTVQQRGNELFAEVYDRGGATATGRIDGSAFVLEGRRLALPFTVNGRVEGNRMTGILSAIGTERRFTGIRRGRR